MTLHMLTPTTEADYRKYPALSFSNMAAYYNGGCYSPDHALMKVEYKSYFEYGRQFEAKLQDTVKGTQEFEKRFFKSTVSGKMPDNLIEWIDNGEDLESHIKLKKDGTRNMQSKKLHAFIDEAMSNHGKIPVSVQDWDMLELHVERMLKMQYLDAKVEDILAAGEWQVPITWIEDDLPKKALVDCLVDLGGEYLPVDIKTAAGFKKFGFMLRDKYWIQDLHYTEGVNAVHGASMQMVFFVASKEAPCLCQPWSMDYSDPGSRAIAIEDYRMLCESYHQWSEAGRYPKGWLPLQAVKHYPKNI
jgi:hypothetical protein